MLAEPWGARPAFRTFVPRDRSGRPPFGPYVFIQIDLDDESCRWQQINSMPEIRRLLPVHLEKPSPLPSGFIDDLREKVANRDFDEDDAMEVLYSYAADEQAIVTSGGFEGHVGRFKGTRKGFINLSLVFFNRPMIVPIPAHQVRPLPPRLHKPDGCGSS